MKHLHIFSLLLCFFLLASCGEDDGIQWGGSQGNSTFPENVTARMEIPVPLSDGTTLKLYHYSTGTSGKQTMTYCLEYDVLKLHARWVAFRFDGDTRAKNVSRTDTWADDPDLPSQYQIGTGAFSGYNRGHLCASADRLYSTTANQQTFYMSNMSPMLGSFNQGYWVTLEGHVQDLGRDASFADTLYIVKGGTIKNDQISGYANASSGKQIAVPKYYYMALLKIKNGVYSSIAFLMEHKNYGYSYSNQAPLSVIKADAVSVNRLEDFTGIDFFPNLPDAQEEQIEAQLQPASWKM